MESNPTSNSAPDEQHASTSIVCLYAMRDEPLYRELQTHLVLWQTKGHIRWLDVSAGADTEQTLLAFVQQADCVLFLISSSFFATSLLHKTMESALAEQAKRGVPVVPILARACDWKESACGGLKALPDNELPIAEWEHQERAYENIRAGLVRLIPGLAAHLTDLPVRPKHFQARDLPKGYVPRPKAFDAIKQVLLKQGGQTTAITTALRGAGGFGKTTLALALCHDPDVQATFPDGILWVELGENPHCSRDVLNGILHSLEPSLSRSITLEEARENFRRALAERECLLVIDDVWQASALEPLLEGGLRCKRLVTTRNDQVLPKEAARIPVDAMEPAEAIALLCQGLSDEIQQTASQSKLEALVRRLGCWPILLTLARGLIAERVRRGRTLEQAVEIVEQAYQDRGVTAFDVGQAITRQQAVHASVEVSLRHLEEFTPARYQTSLRYQELAVFPEDTDISLAVLQVFWQATGNLKPWETEDLCIHLHRLSLLLTCDLIKGTIRLHDVMHNYLMQHNGLQIPALSSLLLRAHKWENFQFLGRMSERDEYLWKYLGRSLIDGLDLELLQEVLTNLYYLTYKAVYIGVSALEEELLMAYMFERSCPEAPEQSSLASTYRAVKSISHLLRRATTPAEMGGLLLSYLGPQPPFASKYRKLENTFPQLENTLPRPFLTAFHSSSGEGSATLIQTLRSLIADAQSRAVGANGRFIVSVSQDCALRVWDAQTEQCLLTFPVDEPLEGCAFHSDGEHLVAYGEQCTYFLRLIA